MNYFPWLERLTQRIAASAQHAKLKRRKLRTTARSEGLESRLVLAAPTLQTLGNVTLLQSSPLMISLDGADADGQKLTYEISSTNPNVTGTVHQNQSAKLTVANYGTMTFQLLEDLVPRGTEQFIALAQSKFYDGTVIHRVDSGNLYGGDPNGNPPGSKNQSSLGFFDDQFNVDLQHNRAGILSFEKLDPPMSGGKRENPDDRNDAQFIITGGPTRGFDFAKTIFGVQIEGETVRNKINTDFPNSGRPLPDVVISSVQIVDDHENGVLLLKAAPGVTSGTSTITVTVRDSDGQTAQQSFTVTIQPDTVDSAPFLAAPPTKIRTLVNLPTSLKLTAIDVEGNGASILDEDGLKELGVDILPEAPAGLDYTITDVQQDNTDILTITPSNGLTGTHGITVAAGLQTAVLDYQVLPIEIVSAASPLTVNVADHPMGGQINDGKADTIRIKRVGTQLQVLINDTLTAIAEDVSVSQIIINGSGDDDILIVDTLSGGPVMPTGGLVFNAGGQTSVNGDSLQLNPPANGTTTTITHNYTSATNGNIQLDSVPVVLTGIDTITDNYTATNRVFNFGSNNNVLVVGDDGVASNGISKITTSGSAPTITFKGPSGSFTLDAGGGADSITIAALDAGEKAMTLLGGAGNDTISAGNLNDSIFGGDDNDLLVGFGGNDSVYGGSGNDTLYGASGSDLLQGEAGNDLVDGQGASLDSVGGGLGNDTVKGGAGGDVLFETGDAAVITFTASVPVGGVVTATMSGLGTDSVDGIEALNFTGGDAANKIDVTGFNAATTVYGGGGNDTVLGGPLADVVLGLDGDDSIVGNGGTDFLYGAAGKDFLDGGDANDRLFGQGGSGDVLVGGLGNDTLDGGAGTDTVVEIGNVNFVLTNTKLTGMGTDSLFGVERAGLTGGAGNNTIDASAFFFAGVSDATLNGGEGNDSLIGAAGFALLNGDAGNDTLVGNTGNDQLNGGAGGDSLNGGVGNDSLRGGDDSGDVLQGGIGNDLLDGGAGDDTIFETVTGTSILTNTSLTGNGTDTVTGVEAANLVGSNAAETIDASAFTVTGARVTLQGAPGNDTLIGTSGNDLFVGGTGNDIVKAGAGNDTLDGGFGNDGLSGASGNDSILGGDNDDTIYGGSGNDTVRGGTGNDIVIGGAGVDSVEGNDGTDKIAGGSGNGSAQQGDVVTDLAGQIDENFKILPTPSWVEEV